jgi:hypothetical protein
MKLLLDDFTLYPKLRFNFCINVSYLSTNLCAEFRRKDGKMKRNACIDDHGHQKQDWKML